VSGGARRAAGTAGLCGALAGARCVAQWRLGRSRAPARRALGDLARRVAVLALASAAFASPPAVALAGCAAGAGVGLLAAPRVVGIEKEFALRGDARDAARAKNKKARALAVTLSARVKRDPPRIPPPLLFCALLLALPALRVGLAQLLPALVTAAARPGALSHRALACPPRFA